MITVSDSFKKAIKSDNREIYGYVDVTYDKRDGEYNVTEIPTVSVLSREDGSDLIDDIKLMKNYATLENNYFLLDGSFILANKNTLQDSGGYVSEDIFSNMSDKTITMVSSETGYVTTKGFTIFFKDNIPFDFDIDIITNYAEDIEEESDEIITINVTNNTRRNYQYIFEEEVTIKEFKLTIKTVEFNDRRIRIPDINFSLTDVYQGEELVSFEVNEEIDLLVESLPINTCTINLNNYPDENGNVKFDPISPTGMTQYLTENTTIIPYIGVLTEENGIEYVKMGTFYLKEWSSDNDSNITINSENLMGRLNNMDFVSDGTLLRTERSWTQMGDYLTNMTGFVFDFPSGGNSNGYYLRHTNLGEWLLAHGPFLIMTGDIGNYITWIYRPTRNNTFELKRRNMDIVDIIPRNELIEDVKYTTKSVVREVNITDITNYSMTSSTKENVLDDNHILYDAEEYIWYTFNKYTKYSNGTFSYSVVSGSGRAELIDVNHYMCYIKITGTVGSVINVKYNGYVYEEPPTKVWRWTNDLKTGDTLNLDFHEYFDANDTYLKNSAEYYLTQDKKYVVTGTTIGDPSLECGDTINIQTRYEDENDGYKEMIIIKQKFTYDGGLQCEIEGRGN